MTSEVNSKGSGSSIEESIPKVIGYYKRQVWAVKVFEKIDQENIIADGENIVLASSVIRTSNDLYFPAFIQINTKENGKLVGAYLIVEGTESFGLYPLETALEKLDMNELLPFKYRTLEKIDGDQLQINWPDFS